MKSRLMTGLACIVLNGCTFSAPQFESALSLVKGIGSVGGDANNERAAVWLATLNGEGAVLTPYEAEGFIVFANADGDAIAFDGWTIRSIMGFGLKDAMSIEGREGDRKFFISGSTNHTYCGQWSLYRQTWSQSCANGVGEIGIDEKGNIELITMSLGDDLGSVSLRLAR